MTLPLLRSRPTTARGRSTLARTAASLLGLGLFLAGPATAQQPGPALAAPPAAPQVFSFQKPANAPLPAVQRAVLQQPMVPPVGPAAGDPKSGYQIQLEPPGPDRLFGQLQSDAQLQEQMRQEARERTPPERIVFPEEPALSKTAYNPDWRVMNWPRFREVAEPSYVCYGKLQSLFEDKNAERFGWDLGYVQPFLSAMLFYKDVATFPYHLATDPYRCYECNAGYCLPGDPVPFLIYPPGVSATGALAEAGAILALVAIFP